MNDDVSQIPTTGCSVLSSSDTLTNYTGNVRKDFTFSGGKWILYRTQTNNYSNYDVSGYNCIVIGDLKTYAIYEPFIYICAFGLFVFVIALFFKSVKGFLYGL